MTLPPEFDLIARHFAPLAGRGAFGLTDDAALLAPPAGRELVLTADAIVAGVHFLPDDPPDLIARKLLRVNLSDLAAKGAEPLGYLLTMAVPPETPESWFAAFAAGLARDQAEFGLPLLGGDTTKTAILSVHGDRPAKKPEAALVLSATLIGTVLAGGMVRRAGAAPGDELWVTGTIGDGALGLLAAQGRLADPTGALADRYRLPRPRLGLVSPALVSAALDVSDGLLQDLGHLCRASGMGAVIEAERVPLSAPARAADDIETCLTGGDDYELLIAVPPSRATALAEAAASRGIPVTRIGAMTEGGEAVLLRDGKPWAPARAGWSHF